MSETKQDDVGLRGRGVEPLALTIAGFDPSGGAGVLADVRTFAAFGFSAVAAITSITFQDSDRVHGAKHETADTLKSQLAPLVNSARIACAKTGMLPTREVVKEVARILRETDLPAPVVDPVLVSSSGYELMEEDAIAFLIDELFPLARLVTPNIPEAVRLTGLRITSEEEMRIAASKIRGLGARSVLIKGGHLNQEAGGRTQETNEAIDVLDDGGKITTFRSEMIEDAHLHGSGCILSSAIAAGLGKGNSLEDAVRTAKDHVLQEWLRVRP